MKRIISVAIAFVTTMFLVACGGAKLTPEQQTLVKNQTELYTQSSMWVEKNRVYGTNFSKGLHIPVNTKVKILAINAKVIKFEYLGTQVHYYITEKHTKIDAQKTLDRVFSTKEVNLSKFLKSEKKNILEGKVEKGMSKEAVLVARGYPPMHVTSSLEENLWKFWRHRFSTANVIFKDNKVVEIEGAM